MKFMMKKTLSVIIALAMILVPMAVFAAGESEFDPIYLDGTQTTHNVTVEAGATVYFSYQSMSAPLGASFNVTVSNSTEYHIS